MFRKRPIWPRAADILRSDVLELTGDILNWAAAGVLFPLLLLPLARCFYADETHRFYNTAIWYITYGVVFLIGVWFVILVPRLNTGQSFAEAFSASLTNQAIVLLVAAIVFILGGPQRVGRLLAPLFGVIVQLTGRAVMWLLLVMALVQFAVVLLRYVFGVNEIFMQESITYMHGAIFLLAAGYALLTNDHVRVDIFYRDAPPKRKAIVDLLGTYLFLFPVCLIILWTASPYVARSWAFFEGSADTSGIQGVFLLKSLIPAFAVLLSMAGFVIAHKAVETLKGRSG